MATLAGVKADYSLAVSDYDQNVSGQAAKDYENSNLCKTDASFIEFYDTFLDSANTFYGDLYDIYCDSKYSNTSASLSDLKNSVSGGLFTDGLLSYRTLILDESKALFDDFLEDFNGYQKTYDKYIEAINGYIKNAEEYQRRINTLINYRNTSTSDNQDTYDTAISSKEKARDRCLINANAQITALRGYIRLMKDLLDKGLKKVS